VAVVIMHVHKYDIKITYMKDLKKFKSGGLHEKHAVATWEFSEPSQHSLIDTETKKNL